MRNENPGLFTDCSSTSLFVLCSRREQASSTHRGRRWESNALLLSAPHWTEGRENERERGRERKNKKKESKGGRERQKKRDKEEGKKREEKKGIEKERESEREHEKEKETKRDRKRESERDRHREREQCTAAASMESCHGLLKKSLDLSLGALFCFFFLKERGKKLLQGSEKWPDPSLSERVSEEREEEAEEEEGLQRGVIFRGKGLYSCSTENKLH